VVRSGPAAGRTGSRTTASRRHRCRPRTLSDPIFGPAAAVGRAKPPALGACPDNADDLQARRLQRAKDPGLGVAAVGDDQLRDGVFPDRQCFAIAGLNDARLSRKLARISGVTESGLFVTAQETGATGLIPILMLIDDRYDFDRRPLSLIGRSSVGSAGRGRCDLRTLRLSVAVADSRAEPSIAGHAGRFQCSSPSRLIDPHCRFTVIGTPSRGPPKLAEGRACRRGGWGGPPCRYRRARL
jgi:hypothetical protein